MAQWGVRFSVHMEQQGIYVQQPLVQVAQINEDIVPAGVVHLIAFILFFT